MDRSIDGPGAFIQTNITGTYTLLEAARAYWQGAGKPAGFRFHHISTDEVFGSLGPAGQFTEDTPYAPRSPYSASKAGSDHLVRAWSETYGLPIIMTNCSNNYGPFVEDHADALLTVLTKGELGRSYNIGGENEVSNLELVKMICALLDERIPSGAPHADLITFVSDRPGHDQRYAIDPTRILAELGWKPSVTVEEGLAHTVDWYLENEDWWTALQNRQGVGDRLGRA